MIAQKRNKFLNTLILFIFLLGSAVFAQKTDKKEMNKKRNISKSKKTKKRRRKFTLGNNKMPRLKKGIKLPKAYLRGIYLNNQKSISPRFIQRMIPRAKEAGINCFVMDVAPYMSFRPRIRPKIIKSLIDQGIYPIARIVAFQYGLKRKKVTQKYLNKIFKLVDLSVKAGFKEIQLDYIRFADGYWKLSLKKKYRFISNLLKIVKKRINNSNIPLATDVFGRIVYNRNDVIGQQLENMAKYADVICPMVYPSHYYPDRYKVRNPYFTVRQSTVKGLNRVGKKTLIMPYIQAFHIRVSPSRLSFEKYMERQMQAVEDTPARGWIFWNARIKYHRLFRMLKAYYARYPEKLKTNNPGNYNPETGEVPSVVLQRYKKYSK